MNRLVSTIIPPLCVMLFMAASARAQLPVHGRPVPSLSDFDDTMQTYMNANGIEAGVLAVSVNGRVVYQRGFGTDIPENTPFRLASVEKPICAAAIQKLIADGDLSMTDNAFDIDLDGGGILTHQPYNSVLGDPDLRNITIMHLLDHRGGWDQDTAPDPFDGGTGFDPQFHTREIGDELGMANPAGPDEIIEYMLSRPLEFTPGTIACADGYCYSNFGYMVLGRIVEEISGLTLMQFYNRHILTPAMDVPNQELIFGQSFGSWGNPREPYYQCGNCDVPNVFFPGYGPETVEKPYGGWHHEAFMGHGNLVASAAPLLEYMNRYQVGVQSNAGVPIPPGGMAQGNFTGGIDGISTRIVQGAGGNAVNIVVFFSKRSGVEHAAVMGGLIATLANSITTWPSTTSDGFWTDFTAPPAPDEVGGYHHPFGNMTQALGVGAGARVRLKPGATDWTGTISHRVRFDAPEGIATIGQ